ncbi:MAG: response regulator [Sandaracinus sp.]
MANRPHIVFVDDEPMALAALGNRLRKYRTKWEISFCTSGDEALGRMKVRPPVLVVADLGMPGMDGNELLHRVQRDCPQAVRIALSGQVAADAATRALSVAHQYLSKPCDVDQIVEIVERRQRLDALFGNPEVVALVAASPTLPPAPRTYAKLTSLLALARWTLDDIVEVVEADAVLTAKLIQVAASPFFGFRRPIASVREAVRVLGVTMVQRLALGLEAEQDFPPIPFDVLDVEEHARHSSKVAARAAELATREESMDAYVAGLVHDLGRLVLAMTKPDDLKAIRAIAPNDEEAQLALERSRLGFGHPELGAALLALWGLPNTLVTAVMSHHDAGAEGLGGLLAKAVTEARPAANDVPWERWDESEGA